MFGDMLATVLLVGSYGVIAVLSARAVLRAEFTRSRVRADGTAARALAPSASSAGHGRAHPRWWAGR